jgi:hypothetical protein
VGETMTPEEIMIQYLLLKVEQKDWHGVSDAANDLREMQAKKEKKEWVGLTDDEKQKAYLKIDTWDNCVNFIELTLREKNK